MCKLTSHKTVVGKWSNQHPVYFEEKVILAGSALPVKSREALIFLNDQCPTSFRVK